MPQAYTVSSVDELPSDVVDGSTAIVLSESIVGEWEWKDLENLDLSMLNLPPIASGTSDRWQYGTIGVYGYDNVLSVFAEFEFESYGTLRILMGGTLLVEDGELDDTYNRFKIFTDVTGTYSVFSDDAPFTSANFRTFIKTNCNRLSGGYSLYTYSNGEWIYKCEIV